MVSQNIFWNISELTHWSSCQCEGEVMMDMWSIKEMIQCATFGIPKRMKKCNFYCFLLWLFGRVVRNRIFIDKGLTMTPFLSTQLSRLITHFTCLLFQMFFPVLLSSEVIFYFWSKSEGKKAKEIEIAFLYSLGNPKVAHQIISFMLHMSVIISAANWYPSRSWSVSWNVSEVISESSTSAFNYWDNLSHVL